MMNLTQTNGDNSDELILELGDSPKLKPIHPEQKGRKRTGTFILDAFDKYGRDEEGNLIGLYEMELWRIVSTEMKKVNYTAPSYQSFRKFLYVLKQLKLIYLVDTVPIQVPIESKYDGIIRHSRTGSARRVYVYNLRKYKSKAWSNPYKFLYEKSK